MTRLHPRDVERRSCGTDAFVDGEQPEVRVQSQTLQVVTDRRLAQQTVD